MESVDISNKFNHCTALMYCADRKLKSSSSIGLYSDCTYSKDGSFSIPPNCQVRNTPTVVFSLGNERDLKLKGRLLKNKAWVDDPSWGAFFCIENNTHKFKKALK